MKKPLVSILIVTYNSEEYLEACLKSIFLNNYPNFEVLLVDNNSTDKSKTIINKYKRKYSQKVFVRFENKNLGYAKANNLAAKMAQGEYLFILNPDTIVEKDFLSPLVKETQKENIVAVQPIVYLFDKETINLTGKVTHYLAFDWLENFKTKHTPKKQQIYSLSGSGILLDKEIFFEVGGFDENYFMYYEDSDLSWKINLIGKKIIFNPNSKLYHDYKYLPKEEYQPLHQKLFFIERNRVITLLKNYSFKSLFLIFPIILFMEIGMVFFAIFQGWGITKIKTYLNIVKNFKNILEKRKFIQKIRNVPDAEIINHFKSTITFEKFSNPILTYIVNPILQCYFFLVKHFI